ncbi:ATP-dependent zinc metalloprotease FtsH [Holzapfeliella floricola]|uniref:ATP-dependent zinc metalloprotease FtsH n=1 Tax=Holzapfeliella floricola DSM 23037 = JCM 16512 TaxID=1423744 RepID=A0A0R2DJJ9_9LACO|nr:ATP-dependent zinc metalloprotease FtsH [Holzapfeliella floricola]KRN04303.1 ATP-dependent Zn protease [Holzapfeliella floricola DSM 23037 = JCM 16512]
MNKSPKKFRNNIFFYIIAAIIILAGFNWFFNGGSSKSVKNVSYSEFITQLNDNSIDKFSMQPVNGAYTVSGTYKTSQTNQTSNNSMLSILTGGQNSSTQNFSTTILANDNTVKQVTELAQNKKVNVSMDGEPQTGLWLTLLGSFLPIIIIAIVFFMMMGGARGGQGGGGNRMMNVGRSKAKPEDPTKNKIRFSDVAGAEEEKQELVEVVEFLKQPKRFASLGARIPSGVLLEGPPGTGKTLLAKAVAGEAKVPFYSISGSDFVEMFVGVGASRVRDLFENAKKSAPAIIFIDEIDAVGRQRGAGMGGGNDEREQTLNQLLVEMDGFTGTEGVIVMAATNRSDVLDPALLRPGRFDRKVLVGRPDVKGREAILKVHAKNKPLAEDVDLKLVARQTPGFVGADLENLLNEAALVAARRNDTKITSLDIDEAEDRVIAGPAKRDRKTSEKYRQIVAYHEAGHALIGLVLSDSRTVRKVTIVPRGRAGGYAITLPKEDQFLLSKKDLEEQIVGLMGGRTAEELIFDSLSSGASNDFEQATQIARTMVTQYGMSDVLGTVALEQEGQAAYGQGPSYSQDTAAKIDQEVRRIINEAHTRATEIIKEYHKQHDLIAKALLEYETLNEKQILSLFEEGKMPEESTEFPSEKDTADYKESKQAADQREKQSEAKNAEEISDQEKSEKDIEKEVTSSKKDVDSDTITNDDNNRDDK